MDREEEIELIENCIFEGVRLLRRDLMDNIKRPNCFFNSFGVFFNFSKFNIGNKIDLVELSVVGNEFVCIEIKKLNLFVVEGVDKKGWLLIYMKKIIGRACDVESAVEFLICGALDSIPNVLDILNKYPDRFMEFGNRKKEIVGNNKRLV